MLLSYLVLAAAASATPQVQGAPQKVQNTLYADIRGFGYHPTWAATCESAWGAAFNTTQFQQDVRRGKQLFPKMSALRVFLCLDAFVLNPAGFLERFLALLDTAHAEGIRLVVTLFNAWASYPNWGGQSAYQVSGYPFTPACKGGAVNTTALCVYVDYLDAVLGGRARTHEAVLLWDVMNEPPSPGDEMRPGGEAYATFVRAAFDYIKAELKPSQPITVSCDVDDDQPGSACGPWGDTALDALILHPYWHTQAIDDFQPSGYDSLVAYVDSMVARANRAGKPLLADETCWGANDDRLRASTCNATLRVLASRGIGFLPHALHWSPAADCHTAKDGPQSNAGYMAFIERDGRLRPHHGVFNDF